MGAELCLAHDMGDGGIWGAPFGRHAALRLFHFSCCLSTTAACTDLMFLSIKQDNYMPGTEVEIYSSRRVYGTF